MGKKRQHEEEHADETWLIPYSDLLTLLLALFIVLFASSQVDNKKFQELAQSFSGAFHGNVSFFSGTSNAEIEQSPSRSSSAPPLNQDYIQETSQLKDVKRMLDAYINANNFNSELETSLTDQGLMIHIRESALFASGSAQLRPESRRIAAEIAKMLVPLSQQVIVSGHTDNVPINTADYPSNWELSSRRAVNFMRFLLAQEPSLPPGRFSATGYAEYHPVADNQTEEGRQKNRRVDVLIQRQYTKAEQ